MRGCLGVGGSGSRLRAKAHLSDDETVAKMVIPNPGHPPVWMEGSAKEGNLVVAAAPLLRPSAEWKGLWVA